MTEKLPSLESLQISYVFKGLLSSIIITIILSIIFSLLLQYTPLSESLLSGFSTFVFFISMFLGSTIAAHTAGHKGLLYSTTVSFSYFLLILCFCLCLDSSLLTFPLILKKIVSTIVSSFLGGIIGIGLISH
jgi:putative membrane protein (TIGR04086 family)